MVSQLSHLQMGSNQVQTDDEPHFTNYAIARKWYHMENNNDRMPLSPTIVGHYQWNAMHDFSVLILHFRMQKPVPRRAINVSDGWSY